MALFCVYKIAEHLQESARTRKLEVEVDADERLSFQGLDQLSGNYLGNRKQAEVSRNLNQLRHLTEEFG